jgi:2-C-methyl-D-erythritol 2,4-cyclodiphosphate synthase
MVREAFLFLYRIHHCLPYKNHNFIMQIRIGNGIDFHRLEEGIPFWLGGIKLEHPKGAVGHSDADVLLHAICDAMLGAAGLGDIGTHFPDTDIKYKGIDSKVLLRRSYNLIREKGYWIVNIDTTVCLQEPKIKPHIPKMIEAIASTLGIPRTDVSIKATTTEQLGFVGREEGVMAYASVLIDKH